MKLYSTRTVVRAGIFTLSLAVLPSTMTADAQTNSNLNSTTMNSNAQATRVVERDDDTDFGWVGLLGLAGLAGLLKKPKQVVVDRTPDTTARPNAYDDKRT